MVRRNVSVATLMCVVALVGSVAVLPLDTRQASSEQLTLEGVRKILTQPQERETVSGIPLAGFEFSREIEIGGGRRVVAISCTRNGGIIAFDANGKTTASVQTGAITSLEVFDLTEDGTSEIVLDEVEGSGTGVLSRAFVVYRVTSSQIQQIWKAESLFRSAPWKPTGNIHVRQKTCFLRFDPSGAGQPATMTHICTTTGDHHLEEKTYEWRGNSVQERKPSS